MNRPIPLTVLRSSRPLILERDETPETRYSYWGTFFFVIWAGYLFAVTARHVIGGKETHRIRLLCHDNDPISLGFDSILTLEGSDNDYKDLAVIAVLERDWCPHLLTGTAALDPSFIHAGREAFHPGAELQITGYPGQLNEIVYDPESLTHQRLLATAEYVRQDPDRKWLHQLRWMGTAGVKALGGMSGSAVLCQSATVEFGLCGVLVQASNPAAPGYFIDSAILVDRLREQVEDIRSRKRGS